jgi:hypothetical protein
MLRWPAGQVVVEVDVVSAKVASGDFRKLQNAKEFDAVIESGSNVICTFEEKYGKALYMQVLILEPGEIRGDGLWHSVYKVLIDGKSHTLLSTVLFRVAHNVYLVVK